jgi:erythromycin esterase-like protein
MRLKSNFSMVVTKILLFLVFLLADKTFAQKHDSFDFSFLHEEIRDKEIVLLGEPDHISTFYPAKIELVKYLHEKLGFDVLAFESGFFEMSVVNGFLNQGSEPIEAFQKGLFPIWSSDSEMIPLFNYVAEQRKKGTPLVIAGFDCQPSGQLTTEEALDILRKELIKNGIGEFEPALQSLASQFDSLRAGNSQANNFAELKALLLRMEKKKELSFFSQSLISWIEFFKNKKRVKPSEFKASDSNLRDSLMASNMLYLYSTKHKGKKIIGWGATAHFTNQLKHLKMKTNEHIFFKPMGGRVKKLVPDKVFVLAVTSTNEEPNSLEQRLSKQGTESHWIGRDSLRLKPMKTMCLGESAEGNWANTVDGIFFTREKEIIAAPIDQKSIEGQLVDQRTNKPVAFASIWIEETGHGTATDWDGTFRVNHNAKDVLVTISCIGYVTKRITLKDLNQLMGKVSIEPEDRFLDAVTVIAPRINAKQYIQEALQSIDKNYTQQPFNLEFYSRIFSTDSVSHNYKLESIIEGYYEGYGHQKKKCFRLTQKREVGNNFLKYELWPPFELGSIDLITDERRSGILNEGNLEKFDVRLTGIEKFEGDTVLVIQYNLPKISNRITGYSTLKRYHGTLFIDSKSHAIIKHQIEVDGNEVDFSMQIIYRKSGAKYFPYHLKNVRTNLIREFGKVTTTNEIILNKVVSNNPKPFANDMQLWNPGNVKYSESFWTSFK